MTGFRSHWRESEYDRAVREFSRSDRMSSRWHSYTPFRCIRFYALKLCHEIRRLVVILITAGLPDRLLDGADLLVMRGLTPGGAVTLLMRFLADENNDLMRL